MRTIGDLARCYGRGPSLVVAFPRARVAFSNTICVRRFFFFFFFLQIINDNALYVKWDDGHESTYGLQWLLERNFNDGQEHWGYEQVKWTKKSFATIFRSFEYEDIVKRL